jgi:predicted membrane chloride channel (bestrophin family)
MYSPRKTGMGLIEEHVPGLYSLRSNAYIAGCFLVPIVLAHLINQIGWWTPLISAAAWNVLAFSLSL